MLNINEKKIIAASKWTEYIEASYHDACENEKIWSFIERKGGVRAVVVVPRIEISRDLLLIRQYRVPLQGYAIEFPAGLVDPGETVEEAALRELKEETGYCGKITSLSGPFCTSPGLTSETVYLADVICQEQNQLKQYLDCSEEIEVFRIKNRELRATLNVFSRAGDIVDSRVATFALTAESGSPG